MSGPRYTRSYTGHVRTSCAKLIFSAVYLTCSEIASEVLSQEFFFPHNQNLLYLVDITIFLL